MESNLRARALEMNGKEKEMVHQKKWAFSWFLKFGRVSDDRIVAGSLFHDAGPATANARSPKLVFERGTRRLPCAAEQSQEWAASSAFDRQSDNLVQCHELLWRLEDKACTWLTQARAASEVCCTEDQI